MAGGTGMFGGIPVFLAGREDGERSDSPPSAGA